MNKETDLSCQLQQQITSLGYPEEFARVVAAQLRGERSLRRMLGYIRLSGSPSAEEIADELLAILEENETWRQKKASMYYNSRYNNYLNDPSRIHGEESD